MVKRKSKLRGRWFASRYKGLKCRVTPFDRDHIVLCVRGSHPTQFQAATVSLEISFADAREFFRYGLKLCDQEQFNIPGGLALCDQQERDNE